MNSVRAHYGRMHYSPMGHNVVFSLFSKKQANPQLPDTIQIPEWEREGWFAGKDFTSDWTSDNFPGWVTLLGSLKQSKIDMLEIGSWEGRSAVFFLRFLPQAHITCVDPFTGSPAFHPGNAAYAEIAKAAHFRFDQNTAEFGDRVEKIVQRSVPALDQLGQQGRKFDVIYIDGSHEEIDVLADSALAWPLLQEGGIMIWDDYEFTHPRAQPKIAIDAFLTAVAKHCEVVLRGYQIAVRKH